MRNPGRLPQRLPGPVLRAQPSSERGQPPTSVELQPRPAPPHPPWVQRPPVRPPRPSIRLSCPPAQSSPYLARSGLTHRGERPEGPSTEGLPNGGRVIPLMSRPCHAPPLELGRLTQRVEPNVLDVPLLLPTLERHRFHSMAGCHGRRRPRRARRPCAWDARHLASILGSCPRPWSPPNRMRSTGSIGRAPLTPAPAGPSVGPLHPYPIPGTVAPPTTRGTPL